jgi:hypothetical protein
MEYPEIIVLDDVRKPFDYRVLWWRMPPSPQEEASTLIAIQQLSSIVSLNVCWRGPAFPEKYWISHLIPCWAFFTLIHRLGCLLFLWVVPELPGGRNKPV